MMSKEEVAEIIAYCRENKIKQCERLRELGIPAWQFYDARRKYASENSDSQGEFLQLMPGGSYVPNPIGMGSSRRRSKSISECSTGNLSIEMRTSSGTMMRIQGEMSSQLLKSIIEAASNGHV